MNEWKLWHLIVTGVLSAVIGAAIMLLIHRMNDTELSIKALAGEVERIDKNTQVLAGAIGGRPPRGSMGIQP